MVLQLAVDLSVQVLAKSTERSVLDFCIAVAVVLSQHYVILLHLRWVLRTKRLILLQVEVSQLKISIEEVYR